MAIQDTITIENATAHQWSDALRTSISFLTENEEYGDDWHNEIATLEEILQTLQDSTSPKESKKAQVIFGECIDNNNALLRCPQCANTSDFEADAIQLTGRIHITPDGWDYLYAPVDADFTPTTQIHCNKCNYTDNVNKFYTKDAI